MDAWTLTWVPLAVAAIVASLLWMIRPWEPALQIGPTLKHDPAPPLADDVALYARAQRLQDRLRAEKRDHELLALVQLISRDKYTKRLTHRDALVSALREYGVDVGPTPQG